MSAQIISIERLAEQQGTVALALGGITVGGRKAGIAAKLTVEQEGKQVLLGVSKLEGEAEWIVDSITIGSFPVVANGVGSRCSTLRTLNDAATIAELNAAAEQVIA